MEVAANARKLCVECGRWRFVAATKSSLSGWEWQRSGVGEDESGGARVGGLVAAAWLPAVLSRRREVRGSIEQWEDRPNDGKQVETTLEAATVEGRETHSGFDCLALVDSCRLVLSVVSLLRPL